MRSSSSAARRLVTVGHAGDLAEWSPDVLPAGSRRLPPAAAREIETAVAEAVDEAVGAERARLEARLAEVEAERAAERERIDTEAYDRGYEEGRIAGELAEGARLRTAVQAAEEALDSLRAGEVRWTGSIEENVCALAVVIARQVVGRELKTDIGPVADLVRTALAEFPIDQPIRIRINPSDLTALNSVAEGERDPMQDITKDHDARWLPDVSIAPGGCMVEGRERIIDGRIDTALERVYRRLTYTNA